MTTHTVALNIADLTRYSPIVTGCMIAPVIAQRTIVDAERGQMDGSAVVLECEPERAEAIVEFLRDQDNKLKQYPIRAYRSGTRGGWARIPNHNTSKAR